jgi:hypothetical protein
VIESCTFEQFNIKLISFESVFKTIEVELINDLARYQLIPAKHVTRDIKKLLYHHVFYGISEYLLNLKTKERVIVLRDVTASATDLLIFQHFNKDNIQKHIDQVVTQVAKLLPISIYGYTNIEFKSLKELYNERNGDAVELIERIRSFMWTKDFMRSYYTFSKVKGFAKRNELTFLSEKYFNQLKTKQLLFV